MASRKFAKLQVRFRRKLSCVRSINPSSGGGDKVRTWTPPVASRVFEDGKSARDANALANIPSNRGRGRYGRFSGSFIPLPRYRVPYP
eukprot:437068-Pyramimonas_sp.AAC.1